MVLKLIDATQAKPGTTIIIDGEPYSVKTNEISKTGKHGHAKCRISATALLGGKKKVLAVPGHERFEVPLVEKKKAQILSVEGETATVMDLESFETFEIKYMEELKDQLKPETQVEYWDVEGKKLIMKVL